MDLHPQSVQLELAAEPSASATVRYTLDEFGLPAGFMDRARLLATELVTNSVRHAGAGPMAPISVTVDIDEHRLRVAVEDTGHGEVRVRPEEVREAGSGYGLFIVETMSDRWGTSRRPEGTIVWFELDLGDAG
jgi:anti-sigma regulatory factor (Ser/Thr protein kinase)